MKMYGDGDQLQYIPGLDNSIYQDTPQNGSLG